MNKKIETNIFFRSDKNESISKVRPDTKGCFEKHFFFNVKIFCCENK